LLDGYFITGSDTGVGKTWVSCQLVQQLRHCHSSVKVRKPIESGCEYSSENELLPADGTQLFHANNQSEKLDIITPFRFRAALAPDRASSLEQQTITLAQLKNAVENNLKNNDRVIVEGAGGFLSPICSNALNADLAEALGLKIIIVIEDRLGAINQALLTLKAVELSGLSIHAIILNQIQQDIDARMENRIELKKWSQHPVYGCKHNGQLDPGIFC